MTKNCAIREKRKAVRRRACEAALTHSAQPRHTGTDRPVLRVALNRALRTLPHGMRAVLVLHDVQGLKHAEIAELLGCTDGTSRSQLHKARARMRRALMYDG